MTRNQHGDLAGRACNDGSSSRRRGGGNLGHPGHEGKNNDAGRRDGELCSLAKFGYRERRNGEEDNLAMELSRLLEMCFG
jgi:hypothetical protein